MAVSAVIAALLLLTAHPAKVHAVTQLLNAAASPPAGTVATNFVLTVDYVSEPEERSAGSVSYEVAGLGDPLPMGLVSGTDTNGTWQAVTMLPVGSWEVIFEANPQGANPDPVTLTIEVTPIGGPTPTPAPTVNPTPQPTPGPTTAPTTAPTPLPPSVTPRPAPSATPLPPGVTPGPATPQAASSSADPSATPGSSESPASQAPRGSSGPSGIATASATGRGSPEPEASGDFANAADERGGVGQVGLILLGGVTSTAGAVVLVRLWRARARD